MDQEFHDQKKKALHVLEKARGDGTVDEGIIPVLDDLNSLPAFFTTSSCAGRILVLEIPVIGNKQEASFLGKWHRAVTYDDIESSLSSAGPGEVWLLAQSPIIHVGVKDISTASKLVNIAIASGFKNSNIKSLRKKKVVEICGTERMDVPVMKNNVLMVSQEYTEYVIELANLIIERSEKKIYDFQKNFARVFNTKQKI